MRERSEKGIVRGANVGVTGRGMGDSKDTVLTAEKERAEGPGDVFAEGSGSTTLNPRSSSTKKCLKKNPFI